MNLFQNNAPKIPPTKRAKAILKRGDVGNGKTLTVESHLLGLRQVSA